MKLFTIRIYLFDELSSKLFEFAMELGLVTVLRSFDGMNGIDTIKDVVVSKSTFECLLSYGLVYFPLDCYGHFEIRCPQCGARPPPRHPPPPKRRGGADGGRVEGPGGTGSGKDPPGRRHGRTRRRVESSGRTARTPPVYLLTVSRPLELSLQSSFQLSLTVLVDYRSRAGI